MKGNCYLRFHREIRITNINALMAILGHSGFHRETRITNINALMAILGHLGFHREIRITNINALMATCRIFKKLQFSPDTRTTDD